jgi:hypothetical protein
MEVLVDNDQIYNFHKTPLSRKRQRYSLRCK